MPRRLRIETLGYHHVYNRGVAKGKVFEDERDKAKFIELLASVAREYKPKFKSEVQFFDLKNHTYF